MDKTELLSLTRAENAVRAVEYHDDSFSITDLTRILRIIAGQKPYNEFYDVCPLEIDGELIDVPSGLQLTGNERLVRHPDGQIDDDDYEMMRKLILAGVRPSDLTTAEHS